MDPADFPVFKRLNPTQLENFVAACREVDLARGEVVIEQGSSGSCFYFVLSGSVEVYLGDPASGEEHEIVTLQAPAVIGEMEALTGERRAANVRVVTPVRALALDFATFQKRVDDGDPATLKVVFQIACVLARRLAMMDRKLAELGDDTPAAVAIGDLRTFQRKLADEWTF